jgi:hypothetical protein
VREKNISPSPFKFRRYLKSGVVRTPPCWGKRLPGAKPGPVLSRNGAVLLSANGGRADSKILNVQEFLGRKDGFDVLGCTKP